MDELERKIMDSPGSEHYERRAAQAIEGATAAWVYATGLEPAYIEVLGVNEGINKNRYLVEIDGVRLWAFDSVANSRYEHYWGIKEPWGPKGDFNLEALKDSRVLRRRRKRLRKRGLYNG